MPGQSGKRSRSRIRRLAKKSSILDTGATFPKTGDGRAWPPRLDDPGAKDEAADGRTSPREACEEAAPFLAKFAGRRPGLPRPTPEPDVAEAIIPSYSVKSLTLR